MAEVVNIENLLDRGGCGDFHPFEHAFFERLHQRDFLAHDQPRNLAGSSRLRVCPVVGARLWNSRDHLAGGRGLLLPELQEQRFFVHVVLQLRGHRSSSNRTLSEDNTKVNRLSREMRCSHVRSVRLQADRDPRQRIRVRSTTVRLSRTLCTKLRTRGYCLDGVDAAAEAARRVARNNCAGAVFRVRSVVCSWLQTSSLLHSNR